MKVRVIADNNIIILNMMMMMISGEFHSVILLWSSNCINIGHQELRVSSELLASWKMETGGQCRLRPSAGLDKEVLSFQKEVLRVSLFSNYSKKLLKTGPPVLIICTFSMGLGARSFPACIILLTCRPPPKLYPDHAFGRHFDEMWPAFT